MPILWLIFPLFLSRFQFLITSPVNLFIMRTIGAIVGSFMLSGLIIGGCQGHLKDKELVKKAKNEVVIFWGDITEVQTAGAANDPLKEQFYFTKPILGFNLGMTIVQLETLMGDNKSSLRISRDFSHAPGEELLNDAPWLFGSDKNNTRLNIFEQYKNPYGLLVYEICDKSKCPVPLDGLSRIDLTFLGGRLVAIYPWFSDPSANIVLKL